jgi:Holliday junction resolvase RusA-like endonuclease
MKYIFEIPGKPGSKGRPRLGRYGTYTPTKTVNYENLVKYSFLNKYKPEPIEGAVKMKITAIFEVPKSYSKKQREMLLPDEVSGHGAFYTKKPDVDNLSKIIQDALNGLAYHDDAQISASLTFKEYGYESKVIVEIGEV